MNVRIALATILLTCACAGSDATTAPSTPASIQVVTGDAQSGAPGMPLGQDVSVLVQDARGRPVDSVEVSFEVLGGGGFTLPQRPRTDAAGRASAKWYLGVGAAGSQRLIAQVSSTLAATFTATLVPPRPDSTYRGRNGYISYIPGTLPLIISAPHGGSLRPGELPDRTSGTIDRDTNTEELALAIASAFQQRTGKRPHLVLSHLHRIKLDPNREIKEAAGGNVLAEHAWREWNTFVAAARDFVDAGGGGLYIDLHGHGHGIARLELGYLLTGSQLAGTDAQLAALIDNTSIRSLARRTGQPLAALLRGDAALGTLFENAGVPAVPSRQQPAPGGDPYFNGGYNTLQYGSRFSGSVDAIQVEAHSSFRSNIGVSSSVFVDVVQTYMAVHYR